MQILMKENKLYQVLGYEENPVIMFAEFRSNPIYITVRNFENKSNQKEEFDPSPTFGDRTGQAWISPPRPNLLTYNSAIS